MSDFDTDRKALERAGIIPIRAKTSNDVRLENARLREESELKKTRAAMRNARNKE